MDNKEVIAAIMYLIQSDRYASLIREITEIIENWDMHPMYYGGHLSVLNALIELGIGDRQTTSGSTGRTAFEGVVRLIEERRKLIPPLKRVDYQRDLMRERRARIAKALELHERTTGRSIRGTPERQRLSADIQARWNKARAEFIKARGKLSWKDRNAAGGEFWAMIDEKLNENLRVSKREPVLS